MMRRILFLIFLVKGVFCVELSDFFDYGSRTDESFNNLGYGDNSAAEVNLEQYYCFYGQLRHELSVSVNGVIKFTSNQLPVTDDSFPLGDNKALIAPFWADVNTHNGGGEVFYRQSTDPNLINKANQYINIAFRFLTEFNATNLFIATWEQVRYSQKYAEFRNNHDNLNNTFQCVLATDGIDSYVIYLYADNMIQWTTGDRNGGVNGVGGSPAKIGINKGDEVNYVNVTESSTQNILSITQESNIEVSGVYVIRICNGLYPKPCQDGERKYMIGEQVQPNCTTRCTCEIEQNLSCTTQTCTYDGPFCQAFGDPHYRTFDRFRYRFVGNFEYTFLKLCESDDILISIKNCFHGSTSSELDFMRINISSENREILLHSCNRREVMIDGALKSSNANGIIYTSPTVDVIIVGRFPHVFLKEHGLRIFWPGTLRVKVVASSLLENRLCGLCGTYNSNRYDDRQLADGTLTNSSDEFAESWIIPGTSNPFCTSIGRRNRRSISDIKKRVAVSNITIEAQIRCSILNQHPLSDCNYAVNTTDFINDCISDYSNSNETEREIFYCDIISSYASTCADTGIAISNWRSSDLCPLPCPAGMIYQQCGPLCPQTCDNLDQPCEGGCAEGCFCPVGEVMIDGVCVNNSLCTACSYLGVLYEDGVQVNINCSSRCTCNNTEFACETVPCVADGATCVVSGLSHYQTFDLRYFDFQAECEFILTTPCSNSEFIVTVESNRLDQFTSSIEQVNVMLPELGYNISLGRNGLVSINNKQPMNDYVLNLKNNTQILQIGGNTHVILQEKSVTIFWDGLYRVEVTVSTTWQNRLCGLCGNYNGDSSDDFITSGGEIVSSIVDFGVSWFFVYTSGCGPLDTLPLNLFSNGTETGETLCSIMTRKDFAACNELLDPSPYQTNCAFDYTKCLTISEDRHDCICESLATYASACSKQGVVLYKWRESICPIKCPTEMTYQQCGSVCPQSHNSNCYGGCAEGCFCPNGEIENSEQNCVEKLYCTGNSTLCLNELFEHPSEFANLDFVTPLMFDSQDYISEIVQVDSQLIGELSFRIIDRPSIITRSLLRIKFTMLGSVNQEAATGGLNNLRELVKRGQWRVTLITYPSRQNPQNTAVTINV